MFARDGEAGGGGDLGEAGTEFEATEQDLVSLKDEIESKKKKA